MWDIGINFSELEDFLQTTTTSSSTATGGQP